jgi:hypothetical protein
MMSTVAEIEKEYCDVRCGEFRCGYAETGNGKPCDLLTEHLKDQLGAD